MSIEEAQETVEIDGVPCDLEKVKDSVRRCVRAMERVRYFLDREPVTATSLAFAQDLQYILTGESRSVTADEAIEGDAQTIANR